MMRKFAIMAAVLLLAGSVWVEGGTLKTLSPSGFSSNGVKVAGWHWLQKQGDKATWTFTCPAGLENGGRVVFCFSTLSTNGKNGGGGYDSIIRVEAGKSGTRNVTLHNDCPAIKSLKVRGDSHGIGYASHGCISAHVRCSRKAPIHVKASFGGRGHAGNHTAVKKSSLKMVYVKR